MQPNALNTHQGGRLIFHVRGAVEGVVREVGAVRFLPRQTSDLTASNARSM